MDDYEVSLCDTYLYYYLRNQTLLGINGVCRKAIITIWWVLPGTYVLTRTCIMRNCGLRNIDEECVKHRELCN